MALTETRPAAETVPDAPAGRPAPGPLERLIGTGDHVSLGRIMIGFALLLGVATLLGRLVYGVDVASDNGFLAGSQSMLGASTLVGTALLLVVPLLVGIGLVVVPLQVGSPSIAFPRAAALATWTWVISAVLFVASVALDGGIAGGRTEAARLGNVSMGAMMAALLLASVCLATTVVSHRPEGMGLARVPLFSWSVLTGATIWLLCLSAAFAHVVVGQISQADAAALATNFADGVAWLLRGPTVFMIAIPVLGIAGDVVATAAGRPIKRYGLAQGAIGAFAVLSFGAWSQLPSSVNTVVWTAFALAVALPLIVSLGGIIDLVRWGGVKVGAALVGAVLAHLLVLGGVLCGILLALDLAGRGTVWGLDQGDLVTAQAFFVLGGALVGAVAGLVHWSPQIWGGNVAASQSLGGVGLAFAGLGLVALALLIQSVVQRNDGTSGEQLFGALQALGSLLAALGLLGVLAGSLSSARDAGADDDADGSSTAEPATGTGLTYEWAATAPATGGVVADLPPVGSPYPLLDAREGDAKETR